MSVRRNVLNFVWSFVGMRVSLLHPVIEFISSFGGWGVFLTRPVLESVRRARSLSYSSSNLSRRSADGDFILNSRSWSLSGRTSSGESILHPLS